MMENAIHIRINGEEYVKNLTCFPGKRQLRKLSKRFKLNQLSLYSSRYGSTRTIFQQLSWAAIPLSMHSRQIKGAYDHGYRCYEQEEIRCQHIDMEAFCHQYSNITHISASYKNTPVKVILHLLHWIITRK